MKTILVVEDQPDIRRIMAINLLLNGYLVKEAENGAKAIEIAVENPPDLLITDLAMPVQDGTELIYQFKHSSTLKHIPIIVISAVADINPVKELLSKIGEVSTLKKPFSWPELSALLNEKLK